METIKWLLRAITIVVLSGIALALALLIISQLDNGDSWLHGVLDWISDVVGRISMGLVVVCIGIAIWWCLMWVYYKIWGEPN